MLDVFQILVTRRPAQLVLALIVVASLTACGQKGKLYLPQGEAAKDRATLPEIISPSRAPATSTPATSASAASPAPAPASVTPTGQANPVPRP
ncbi:LPS translocon maturation chaperone LptM [Caenimonas koreensis]|uniref:LPS translocon maturation chaperone LptM n=1 Tax=Caenimonas koreensis TaxID=367474 RepID=UPI003784B578